MGINLLSGEIRMDDLFGFEITFLDMKILASIIFILIGWIQ